MIAHAPHFSVVLPQVLLMVFEDTPFLPSLWPWHWLRLSCLAVAPVPVTSASNLILLKAIPKHPPERYIKTANLTVSLPCLACHNCGFQTGLSKHELNIGNTPDPFSSVSIALTCWYLMEAFYWETIVWVLKELENLWTTDKTYYVMLGSVYDMISICYNSFIFSLFHSWWTVYSVIHWPAFCSTQEAVLFPCLCVFVS